MAYLAANLLNTLFLDKPSAELSELTTYNQPIARFDVTSSQESTDTTSTTTSTSTTTPSTSSTSTSSTSSSSSTDSTTTSARTDSSTSSTKTVTSASGSTPQSTRTSTTGSPTTSNGGSSSQSQSPPGQSEPASSPHSTSPILSGPSDTSFSSPSISPTDTSSMTGMISVPTSSITNEDAGDGQPGFGGSSSRAKLPVILGAVLGGLALFTILAFLLFLRQRRRRSRQIAALMWEPARDLRDDDSVAHSTMSSEFLISGVIPNTRDNFRLHAMDTVQEVPEAESRPVSKSPSPTRSHSRPSHYDMSSISSTSTIAFARPPIFSADSPSTPNRNSSAGFYQPSALEDGRLSPRFDDLWVNRPRQTRHSMMTVVPEN